MKPKLVSIELTNLCQKGSLCKSFGCYAKSNPEGATFWTPYVLGEFIRDLAKNGIEAVSFGGGEPLQFEGLWAFLEMIKDLPIFKSMTTNGLLLGNRTEERLAAHLNKVHVSIHFPENDWEVKRVIRSVRDLEKTGLKSGINFIVKGWDLKKEKEAVRQIRNEGIDADRVVFLPLRGKGIHVNADRFKEVAQILSEKFQSTWCLLECKKSDRFVSVNWEGYVGWCSYTPSKTRMQDFTYAGMMGALGEKELAYCG
jgi:MoaA/NifB/PqqE/SkfB family radical SAM enzyme